MPAPVPVLLAWSGGKDAAWTLHALRQRDDVEVVGLLTTLTEGFDRVSMQGIRRDVLHAQARSVGQPAPGGREHLDDPLVAVLVAVAERIGVGAVAGGLKSNEASTTLILVDNRSSVQLAAAEGSAKNWDFNLAGGLLGSTAGGGLGGYTNTPEGKILTAAFMDSYNKLVRAVRNYRAQTVQGGLGTGGRLGVQGGQTPASQGIGR